MNSVLFMIAIPLIGAFLTLFLKKANKWVSLLITLFMEVFSIFIYLSGKLPVSVAIGGWQAPFGINFVLTPLSMGFVILVNLAGIMAVIMIREEKNYRFYSTYLVLLTAVNGMILTGDIFNFFIFVELATFAITALIAYRRDRMSTGAAVKYLILSSTSSVFLLAGIGVIYKTLGTLNMADIASKIGLLNPAVLGLAMVLIFAGIFVELELFPFNIWVPKAYAGSSGSVNLMLHGMLGTAGVYVITRIILTIFSQDGNGHIVDGNIGKIIVFIAVITLIISEMAAFAEKRMKKVLAFSSMGQMGMMLFGLMIGGEQAINGAFYILVANFAAKSVLFILTDEFKSISGSDAWSDMKGIGRKYPLLGIIFTAASLSLMGMPFFAGFWGKLGIIQGALSMGGYFTAGVVVMLTASVIEGIYMLKIAHTLFLKKDEEAAGNLKVRVRSVFMTAVLAVLIVVIGIYPAIVSGSISKASGEVMDSNAQYVNVVFPQEVSK